MHSCCKSITFAFSLKILVPSVSLCQQTLDRQVWVANLVCLFVCIQRTTALLNYISFMSPLSFSVWYSSSNLVNAPQVEICLNALTTGPIIATWSHFHNRQCTHEVPIYSSHPSGSKSCWEIWMWPSCVSSAPEARFTFILMFCEAGDDLTSLGQWQLGKRVLCPDSSLCKKLQKPTKQNWRIDLSCPLISAEREK